MVASILKIVITRNTVCDNLVGFPKSGHNYILLYSGKILRTINFIVLWILQVP